MKPVETAQRLDKQLELIRNYVEANHGQLLLFERERTLKSPPAERNHERTTLRGNTAVAGRIFRRCPADAHLQQMIELGMYRFGDSVLNANNSRREVVIRFHMSDLEARVRELQRACTVNAWNHWCAMPAAKEICTSDQPPPQLQLQTFNVRSAGTVLIPNDGVNRWRIDYGRNPHFVESPDLLGNLPIHLEGNILLTYFRVEKEKP